MSGKASFLNGYYVLSFSLNGDNLALWSEFKSEEEYRFVFWIIHDESMKGKNKLPMCFRVKNDTMIPYVEIKCNVINATTAITIGPKNNMDIAKQGMELYCASKGMKVKVKKSKIPLRY